jgi:deazaflavin-dependent oxidoreductase (nitroreductase family)
VAATGIVFVTGMRAKSPVVVNGVRWLGRAMRPLAIKSAGGPGASASVVHHIGRTSGRSYATPVGAVPIDDGFVIALPYGDSADWLKNVLASGSATIVHDGSTYDVDRPGVVPLSAVEDQFSPGDQRAHRLFGVDQCLRLRRPVSDQPNPVPTG